MANNFTHATLLARANPFGIVRIRGIQFLGAFESPGERYVRFHSRLYAVRAMFSLMRYWQRSKGALTVRDMIEQIFWLDDADRERLLMSLSFNQAIDPSEPLDYRSNLAQRLVKIIAKYVSNYDLRDEDIQTAQKMIL